MSGLWRRIGSAFERTDIEPAQAGYTGGGEEPVRATATRYAPIRQAVERRVHAFLRTDLVSHLEIGAGEVFLLHYIELSADRQGEAELDQFLAEFSPESRVQWIGKLLGGAVGRHVSVAQFLGLDREFAAEDLSETDPYEEAMNESAPAPYKVILHGRWARREDLPAERDDGVRPVPRPAAPGPVRVPGPGLRLSVHDASGSHSADAETFPAVLGSSIHADLEISGYYVSARHCTLDWDAGQLWLADHSTNGTWVDGVRAPHGARVALADGATLAFGRERGGGEVDRYPSLRVQFMRASAAGDAAPGTHPTPVAPSRATPVAPILPAQSPRANTPAPLATLAIADASGHPRRGVPRLPYTIGRGSAQDYVVPEANQGVSREHLVIESLDADGAMVLNLAAARNGTSLSRPGGAASLPERFRWRYGEEIVLGEKWAAAPSVRIRLEGPEGAA